MCIAIRTGSDFLGNHILLSMASRMNGMDVQKVFDSFHAFTQAQRKAFREESCR